MPYKHLGLNSRLQSENSLSARRQKISPLEFSGNYTVQGKNIRMSKVNLGNFVKVSNVATAIGTFTTSQSFDIATTITHAIPHADKRVFGIPHVSFYQGTVAGTANEIWPRIGTAVTLGRYDVSGAHEYEEWGTVEDRWAAIITDTNGTSTQDFMVKVLWSYIDYNAISGTAPTA